MKYNYRKSPRAQWHNYVGANYFVTINTKDKQHFFGKIKNEVIHLSKIGMFLKKQIEETKIIRANNIDIPCYTIMPNHVHLIITFNNSYYPDYDGKDSSSDGKTSFGPQSNNLPSIIRGIKSSVKKYANDNKIIFEWHKRYHDRIIRNHNEMNNIAEYIENNPIKWDLR